MKTYNKLILSMLGSAFVVGAVSAQNWTLNGVTQPQQLTTSSNESAVAIDPLTGVASVKTAGVGPSVSVSANPGAVDINTATTVTWTASNFGNNLNCTRTSSPTLSGWNGASTLASGSVAVTMPSSPQTVSLTLSCSGDNGSSSSFTNVVVSQPGTGVDCSARPPGYNNNGLPSGTLPRTLAQRTYFSLFNAPFPGPIGDRWEGQPNGVGDGTVIALQFVAPTSPQFGSLDLVDSPDRGGFGLLTAGISECPGHVAQLLPGTGSVNPCWGGELKTQTRWTLDTNDTQRCVLIPGKTYYYNVTVVERCLSSGGLPANCGLRMYPR